jgi:hypothetical protein
MEDQAVCHEVVVLDGFPLFVATVLHLCGQFRQQERMADADVVLVERGGNVIAQVGQLQPRSDLTGRLAHLRRDLFDGIRWLRQRDVAGAKHVIIGSENLQSCGPRSGRNKDVFCEIAPVDEFLCCRLCAFQQVCSASDILRLPCNAV